MSTLGRLVVIGGAGAVCLAAAFLFISGQSESVRQLAVESARSGWQCARTGKDEATCVGQIRSIVYGER